MLFKTEIPVRIGDINYGGHLGNDAVLSIIHEVRVQWLSAAGFTELNIDNLALIMADVMIAYRGEAFYGDVLQVKLYADEITDRSFDLMYHLTTLRNSQTIDIAQAKTGMVCYDYIVRKVVIMNEVLKTLLKGLVF